jgi:predicted AAA+ superfamily ATPase
MLQRRIFKYIKDDLDTKMVLLAGPRQCGKTTIAKSLV